MSIVSDQQEFERLRRLSTLEASTLTEFHVWIRADRGIERDEVTALLAQRFPFLSVGMWEQREVVDRL
jgi:hypothetical protein